MLLLGREIGGILDDRCHKESGGARAATAVRSGAMTPAENVLAWLGIAGAPVRLCGDRIEGDNRLGDRIAILDVAVGGDSLLLAHTRHLDASHRAVHEDWTIRGEPGVRYLARWLVDGGRIESPYLERRDE